MADDIAVDIDQLRSSGAALRQLGQEIAGRQGGWKSDVQGSAAVWGADEEGAAFGQGYQEATDAAGQLFSGLAEALDTIGSNLAVMADNLAAADESSQERFRDIGLRLSGPT